MQKFTTWMLQEMSASDKYEKDVADYLNGFAGVKASRPPVSSKYSDVIVEYNGNSSWLEVKMNHTDNLGNTRVFYNGSFWDGSPKPLDPLKLFCTQTLNKSEQAKKFVKDLSDFSRIKNPKIPTTKGGLADKDAVPLSVMKSFFETRNRYIIKEENYDLGKLVTDHYLRGKTKPADYMQAGDDFYLIGAANPLGLPTDIPKLSGFGEFKMRISTRSQFYEVQPEIKILKMPNSNYSVKPGTNKKNPFK